MDLKTTLASVSRPPLLLVCALGCWTCLFVLKAETLLWWITARCCLEQIGPNETHFNSLNAESKVKDMVQEASDASISHT